VQHLRILRGAGVSWEAVQTWFLGLGENYGVNPIIFGAIYVGAIPFFTLSVAWLVRNLRARRSAALPAAAAGLCFISSYLYLLVAGRNVPWWVYAVIAVVVILSAYSTVKSIHRRVRAPAAPEGR
jgi:hypothetical protein